MTDQPYTAEELNIVVPEILSSGFHARLAATLREFQRVLAENEALRADKAKLGWFAGQLLAQLRGDCTPDGGEMQDLLAEAGVIAPVQVTEPCGEGCVCAEYDFPMACYRNTPLGDYCEDAARSGGEGNGNG